ncbi:MAG: neuraminidase-like domain-containing protein [Janthinobacterium lividum]
MSEAIIGVLEEQRRDALVAYYLGQLAPQGNAALSPALTKDDLYEYLLIDNQVTGQVDTSRVAQSIASVQQHIHAIYNGMEPGYANASRESLTLWREGMSQYSVWAGYQMLADYPENYLDPTLRLDKTSMFETFESEIAQARLSRDSVQSALGNYLQAFEVISNLQITGCYVDSTMFVDADYYFIGRQSIEPFGFYWRKAHLYPGDDATKPTMAGWTQWLPIDSVSGAHIKHCRPVVMDGRLYAVWAESGKAVYDDLGVTTGEFEYHLKLAYRRLDNGWSVPILLQSGVAPDELLANEVDAEGVVKKGYRLGVGTDRATDGRRLLAVNFFSEGFGPDIPDINVYLVRDSLLNPVNIDLSGSMGAMLGVDNRRVQFAFDDLASMYTIAPITWDQASEGTVLGRGELAVNQYLTLHVDWKSGVGTLQGFCNKAVNVKRDSDFIYSKAIDYSQRYGFHVEVISGIGDLTFSVIRFIDKALGFPSVSASLIYAGEVLCTVNESDFADFADGYFTYMQAKKVIEFDQDVFKLTGSDGEFIANISDSMDWPLDCSYYKTNYQPAEMEWVIRRFDSIAPVGSGTLILNGAAKTPLLDHSWMTQYDHNRVYQWGEKLGDDVSFGANAFKVERVPVSDPAPLIKTTPAGVHYLDLSTIGIDTSAASIRLNTLIAKELSSKAAFSLESALSWETQHTVEPALPGQVAPVYLDFDGANGLYFWEIFFHVSHLVAWRLKQEFDYSEAQAWLERLFNPQMRVAPLYPPPSTTDWLPYWSCRPLGLPDRFNIELEGLSNPDAIARGAPSHYRKAIFMLYVNNLMTWGDMLYRQVTRDTLNEAKLLYVRAVSLLGPLSKGRSISRWTPATLSAVLEPEKRSFALLESSMLDELRDLIALRDNDAPWLRLLDLAAFRPPVNSQLLDLWSQLEQRLFNLRHNLTLDGKPMQLALYEAPANPLDLLRAQLSGSSLSQRRLGSLAIIPPYRFRAMLPRTQYAVEMLIRFAQSVLNHMESRDHAEQDELQQGQVVDDLATFAERLQQNAIDEAGKSRDGLRASRRGVAARKEYYDELVSKDVSALEKSAHGQRMAAMGSTVAARVLSAAGHVANMAPNLFGGANGGMQWGGAAFGLGELAESAAAVLSELAQVQLTTDMQNRRRDEWQFMARQADFELEILDQQIQAQEVNMQSATTSLEQATKAREQAQAMYAFIKGRACGAGLYQWLLSQMSTLYFQAYDAVLSMCLSTEACWQYEIGDRDTRFISTTAWADNRFGLTAGEFLKLGLLQMESAYLSRHERRLELTKTVSLKALLQDYDPGAAFSSQTAATGWDAVIETLRAEGEINFQLKSSTFDKDYPGHYLRQLVRVSVSLPVVLQPYQDIHATLSQQSSSYLLKPQIGNVKFLYQQAGELAEGDEDIRQDQIVFNPRSNQQIGLSSGVDDHGMATLDFGDERYFPFEGTGAISSWTLSFPNHESESQQAMLATLTDVILHVRYMALDGGKAFSEEVEALVASVEEGEARRRSPPGVLHDRVTH